MDPLVRMANICKPHTLKIGFCIGFTTSIRVFAHIPAKEPNPPAGAPFRNPPLQHVQSSCYILYDDVVYDGVELLDVMCHKHS